MTSLEEFGFNEEELTKKAEKLIENLLWFETHKNQFKEGYANKYIAIYNKEIIDSDKDLTLLKKKTGEQGFDLSFVLFKFVPLEDIIVIL